MQMNQTCRVNCTLHDAIESYIAKNNHTNVNEAILRGQIPIAIMYIIIGSIGFILNFFVIIVHTCKRKSSFTKTTFRALIINLTVADGLSSAAVIALGGKTIATINDNINGSISNGIDRNSALFNFALAKNNIICKTSYVIFFLTSFVSTLTITGMAIMRCLYLLRENIHDIQNQMLQRKKLIIAFSIIWGSSIGFSIPIFRMVEISSGVPVRCFFASCGKEGIDYGFNYILAITLVFCAFPMLTLLICHACLARFLLRLKVNRAKNLPNCANTQIREKLERRAAIIVNFLTLVFISTSVPFIVYQWIFSVSNCNADEMIYYWIITNSSDWIFYEISHLLFVLPPLLNPICYSMLNEGFRTSCSSLCKTENSKATELSTRSSSLSSSAHHFS